MTARPIRAKVLKIQHLTRDIREMTLEMLEPSALVFRPGQSIAVTVPDPNSDLPLLRYFSLASPPRSSRHLVLLLNSHDHGKGSKFLWELWENDSSKCKGILSRLWEKNSSTGNWILSELWE